jgi:hypothetical protein
MLMLNTTVWNINFRLAMRRLEEVLACQQRERQDSFFAQQCLFCRYVARGNRAKLIHHLYMIHHLNLGSPDNLGGREFHGFFSKFIQFQCSSPSISIYCEKKSVGK